jgi:hypothetical protein
MSVVLSASIVRVMQAYAGTTMMFVRDEVMPNTYTRVFQNIEALAS